MDILPSGSLAGVSHGRITNFDEAELRRLPFQDGLYLWVKGSLPESGYEARLAPRYYHERPEYWGVEVVAVKSGDARSEPTPQIFERSVPLTGITGTRGVAVIGVNRVTKLEVSGGS
jgi:hypothetical protein